LYLYNELFLPFCIFRNMLHLQQYYASMVLRKKQVGDINFEKDNNNNSFNKDAES